MQIEAKIIAHSKSAVDGKEIVTYELIYPRIVHAELLTHRLFSRNAASSRAIPVTKVIEMVRENPAMPVRFGANQAGMQDKGAEHYGPVTLPVGYGYNAQISGRGAWVMAANDAADYAEAFSEAGYHKQIANRLLEPFQWMKTIVTATELDNWFWLRKHPDADPTIAALAEAMWEALQNSTPIELQPGDWHVPYYGSGCWQAADEGQGVSLEDALAISSSCCAQVSYRKLDDTIEKAKSVYERLVGSKPVHASPFEHQASPMRVPTLWGDLGDMWEEGVTHLDKQGNFWSGNFMGWIQHRQLIPNNAFWGENKE